MAKNEKTKDTLFFPIYKGMARNLKKRYRKHKTCLEDEGADDHTNLTTYFWKYIKYDIYYIYHIIVMNMTIQVSKDASDLRNAANYPKSPIAIFLVVKTEKSL